MAVAGAVAVPTAAVGLLSAQGVLASRRAAAHVVYPSYRIDHVAGAHRPGAQLRLAVLGDSTAAGVGAARETDSLAVQVAERASRELGRPVHVYGYGVSGARTAQVTLGQVPRLGTSTAAPDAVLVAVGGNDATHFARPGRFSRETRELLAAVEGVAPGAPIVYAGVARFFDARALPQPLRSAIDGWAQLLAARQLDEVERAGGTFVSIARESSERYRGRADAVAADGFHPSVLGYGMWADAIAPRVARALRE